jgi:hypothetical protein
MRATQISSPGRAAANSVESASRLRPAVLPETPKSSKTFSSATPFARRMARCASVDCYEVLTRT